MVSVLNTYPGTRVGADITSSLGMETTTELCHQKCRHIQASNHDQAGILDINIYDIMVGGGGASTEGVGNPVQCQCGQLQSNCNKQKNIYI